MTWVERRFSRLGAAVETLKPAFARVSEAGVRIVIGTVSSIVITHRLSKDYLAQTAYVASLVAIGLAICALGLDQALTRYLQDNASSRHLFRKISRIRLIGVSSVATVLLLYMGISNLPWQVKIYGLIFTFTLISSFSELNVIVVQRFVGSKAVAKPRIWGSVFGSIGRAATVLLFPRNLVPFALAALVEPVWVYVATRRTVERSLPTDETDRTDRTDRADSSRTAHRGHRSAPRVSASSSEPSTPLILKFGLPYFLSGLAIVLYMKIDIVILHALVSKDELAKYVVAVRISELFYFIPTAIYGAVAPEAIRRYSESPLKGLQYIRQQTKVLLVVTFAIVGGIIVFGRPIISVVAGNQYRSSYGVLCVHVLAFVGVSVGVMREIWILLEENGYLSLTMTALGAVLNIALNVALDPHYGAMGAAIATTSAYSVAGFVLPWFSKNGREFLLGRIREDHS